VREVVNQTLGQLGVRSRVKSGEGARENAICRFLLGLELGPRVGVAGVKIRLDAGRVCAMLHVFSCDG
jgi:hypothetical protein